MSRIDGNDSVSRHHHHDGGSDTVGFGGQKYDLGDPGDARRFQTAVEGAGGKYDPGRNQVKVGGKTYDLDDVRGQEAFRKDSRDGLLDGRAERTDSRSVKDTHGTTHDLRTEAGRDGFETRIENDHVDYNKLDNVITVTRDDGKKVRYDLDTKEGREGYNKDIKDGALDGIAAKRNAPPGGTGGTSGTIGAGGTPVGPQKSFLEDVTYNGKTYDLNTKQGREAFGQAVQKDPNVTYDASSNNLKVGNQTYELNKLDGAHAYRQDVRDGRLDGIQQFAVLRPFATAIQLHGDDAKAEGGGGGFSDTAVTPENAKDVAVRGLKAAHDPAVLASTLLDPTGIVTTGLAIKKFFKG